MKTKTSLLSRVNICWEIGDEKKCVTMSKKEAHVTREWIEENNGIVFWFQTVN